MTIRENEIETIKSFLATRIDELKFAGKHEFSWTYDDIEIITIMQEWLVSNGYLVYEIQNGLLIMW
jgi:hypothetical protein